MVDKFVRIILGCFLAASLQAQSVLIDSGGTQAGAYSGDNSFTGGAIYTAANMGTGPWRTQRYGTSFSYLINIPNGTYDVEILTMEPDPAKAVGARVFTVNVNGNTQQLDLTALAGRLVQYTHKVRAKVVNDTLSIAFRSVVGNALVNAIIIRPPVAKMVTDKMTLPAGSKAGDIIKYTLSKRPIPDGVVMLLEGGASTPPYTDLYIIKMTPPQNEDHIKEFEIKLDYNVSVTSYLQFLYLSED